MALLSEAKLNRLVGESYKNVNFSKSLQESERLERTYKSAQFYDVFLSHCSLDREPILQLNHYMENELKLKVFVDWIEMPELDRTKVTPATAATIRDAMNRSASLLYAISAPSSGSTWMPWELGYSDAKHGRVAVLPITKTEQTTQSYSTQQFVGLYPFVDIQMSKGGRELLYVHDRFDQSKYNSLDYWKDSGRLDMKS